MTWEDTDGMVHIVITRSASDIKMFEFNGRDARDKAHKCAEELALKGDCLVTVGVRVRELGAYRHFAAMSA